MKINGTYTPLSLIPTQDANNYYIYFTYKHLGSLATRAVIRIEIKSTHAVPESPAPHPVGGYSFPIQVQTKAEPVLPYIALIATLTAIFVPIKRRAKRKH